MTDRRPQTESELLDFVRSIDVRAPEELHRRTAALVAARAPRRTPRPALVAVSAATALAAVTALVIAFSSGGGSGGTRLTAAASAATLRAATMSAPAEDPHARADLAASVDGVAFPYWEEHFGWRSTGARRDQIGGRTVLTVFYADRSGHRIGYAIVGGSPPPQPSGGSVSLRAGTPYRLSSLHGSHVVTWLRDGHLCIVSGRGVSSATLLRLASWNEHASSA